MNITQLTVVNACLASMGESPVNSLGDGGGFVNSAMFALEQATINEQTRGWYFNIETITIQPNSADGNYYVPSDVLDVVICAANPEWLTLRGRRLYDSSSGRYLEGDRVMRAKVQRLVAFEDLPLMARRLVKAATVLLFQQDYDGDEAKIRDAQREYATAYALLNAQHIRALRVNLLNKSRYRRGGAGLIR